VKSFFYCGFCHRETDQVFFFPLAVTRDFIDLINAPDEPPYASIISLDRAYRAAYDDLPIALRPDVAHISNATFSSSPTQPKSRLFERLFMGLTLHNRLMRLHRPYLARGYVDSRYAYSTEQCLSAARSYIALIRHAREVAFPGLRWWVVLQQCFTAAISLAIDLFNVRGAGVDADPGTRARIEDGLTWIGSALDVLREARNVSLVAQRAVRILEGMLGESESESSKLVQGGARKRLPFAAATTAAPAADVPTVLLASFPGLPAQQPPPPPYASSSSEEVQQPESYSTSNWPSSSENSHAPPLFDEDFWQAILGGDDYQAEQAFASHGFDVGL
jgi:hypothetical protein